MVASLGKEIRRPQARGDLKFTCKRAGLRRGYRSLKIRSRRQAAARLRRTARPRRALGIILILLGMLLWVIATLSLTPFKPSLGVVFGGALVVGGIILITTSV